MKKLLLILIFIPLATFSQLQLSKEVTTKLLKITIEVQKTLENSQFVTLFSASQDTIIINFNNLDTTVGITFTNATKGFSTKQFHNYSKKFNPDFKLTRVLNGLDLDYYYDAKLARLTIKKYASKSKTKLIEIQFLSDTEKIKNLLSSL